MPDILYIKKHDLQPYYYAAVKDSSGSAVDLTGAAIVCTMQAVVDKTLKLDRQSAGIYITDAVNGEFEYRWQSGDTDTAGKYYIEFEITPQSGGKFTVPAKQQAVVLIRDSLDSQ